MNKYFKNIKILESIISLGLVSINNELFLFTMEKPSLNLWDAAETGNIDVLKQWLKYIKENNLGEDYINRRAIGTGNTPLLCAIQNKQIDAVYFLSTIGGACTLTPSSDLRTPLHNACFFGLIPVVILFLENFPDVEKTVNSQDKFGNTPLHEAVLKSLFFIF